MNIIYRNFQPTDVEDIISFWNCNSGWETDLNLAQFNMRFRSSSTAEPIIMLAIEESTNVIVGQFNFLPADITVNGRQLIGYRPFGAIFKANLRERFGITSFFTGKHPMLILYNTG